jgi:hypothetical protein
MAKDGEHFFMCFLAIWISSFEKVLFSSVAHFFIWSLILGEQNVLLNCQLFVYFLQLLLLLSSSFIVL